MIVFDLLGNAPVVQPLVRSFDVLIESREAGAYQSTTTDELKEMIQLPHEFSVIMFGNPFYFLNAGSVDRIVDSDIGYVVYLWSFGIVGSIIYYCFYFYLAILSYKKRNSNDYFKACILVTLIILFFQAKEFFIYARVGFSIHMLLYFAATFQKKYDFATNRSLNSDYDKDAQLNRLNNIV